MKKLFFTLLLLLSFSSNANDMNGEEISTLLPILPFAGTTMAVGMTVNDILNKTAYEEASDILADDIITDQELEEMSLELEQRIEGCIDWSKDNKDLDVLIYGCMKYYADSNKPDPF